MKIRWFGHSKFKIELSGGTSLITDPYDETTGYKVTTQTCDVVTSSHDHFDHNCVNSVSGASTVITQPGAYETAGFKINGILTDHDASSGKDRGKNIVFLIEGEGIRVCHLGDLGRVLTPEEVIALGRVDILMIPVGGYFTIDAKEAAEVVKQLSPRVVIPMHYKTPDINFPITDPEPFVELMKQQEYSISKNNSNTVEFEAEDLPKRHRVILMEYK